MRLLSRDGSIIQGNRIGHETVKAIDQIDKLSAGRGIIREFCYICIYKCQSEIYEDV